MTESLLSSNLLNFCRLSAKKCSVSIITVCMKQNMEAKVLPRSVPKKAEEINTRWSLPICPEVSAQSEFSICGNYFSTSHGRSEMLLQSFTCFLFQLILTNEQCFWHHDENVVSTLFDCSPMNRIWKSTWWRLGMWHLPMLIRERREKGNYFFYYSISVRTWFCCNRVCEIWRFCCIFLFISFGMLLTLSAPNLPFNILLNSPGFPCKRVGRIFFFFV